MPVAIEEFDFSKYDIVLSDSSSFSKGIITHPQTLHISYVHTPMRYAWDDCQKYTQDFGFPSFVKNAVPYFMNFIRLWDKVSADRVDQYIANSNFVANRIQKYYRKNSVVIHPPVAVNKFYISPPRVESRLPRVEAGEKQESYFLMVGRLIAYKRHDIAIEAFNKLKLPLKIIGRGPEMERLKKMAGTTIEFLGRVPEEDLPKYYAECRAFIFPQEEDFGIVAIEAMASGRPLIAYRGGDIPEHMEEGMAGVFFEKQNSADIIEAVKKFETMAFDSKMIRESVLKFDREIFKSKIRDYTENALLEHKRRLQDSKF